jgi:Xaa-Pro aminopeptidase
VRYVTGFYAKGYRPFLEIEYLALVVADGPTVLGTSLTGEAPRATMRSRADDVIQLPKPRNWGPAIEKLLHTHGLAGGRVGFDFMPHWIHQHLTESLPGIKLLEASDLWASLTAIKHPIEVELLKRALHITQLGMRTAIDTLTPGTSEIEVAAAAENTMRLAGSEMTPFISLVATGYNAALFERVATDKIVESGDMAVIDLGCVFQGYTGDFARTVSVGQPSAEQKNLYRAAHLAQQEALKAIRPGISCGSIDALIRDVLRQEGYERYTKGWPAGHQLGYGLHGAPIIGPGVEDLLEPGMVINIEPALSTPDRLDIGGVEIEDTVLVTEDGHELLTNFEYDSAFLS